MGTKAGSLTLHYIKNVTISIEERKQTSCESFSYYKYNGNTPTIVNPTAK